MSRLEKGQSEQLLTLLAQRFIKHMHRHASISWEDVSAKISGMPDRLWSLNEMEKTGGEPDVVDFDKASNQFVFFDCSTESPAGRRSICYDLEGLESRKEHKPVNNAIDMAHAMGIELLNEDQYRYLQSLGNFDLKTSSWIATPREFRKLGGALFCEKRYKQTFTFHNGAQSYYASRGFRGLIKF